MIGSIRLHPARGLTVTAVLVTAGLLAVGIVSVSSATPPGPRMTDNVRPSGARAAVERFLGQAVPGAAITGPDRGLFRQTYKVETPDFTALVDAFDGRVVYFLNAPGQLIHGASARTFDPVEIATRVLTEHRGAMPGVKPTVTRADHGALQLIEVTWQRTSGAIRLPDMRRVVLDAETGAVISYMNDQLPYADPPTTAITQEQAEQTALAACGLSHPSVTRAQILVTFDSATGAQVLVWRVDVFDESVPAAAEVEVDAVTGVGTVTGRG